MDYPLLFDRPGGTVGGLIVEEFLHRDDRMTIGPGARVRTGRPPPHGPVPVTTERFA